MIVCMRVAVCVCVVVRVGFFFKNFSMLLPRVGAWLTYSWLSFLELSVFQAYN